MLNLNQIAIELSQRGAAFAWATVVNVKGSAPRHLGAKMIVTHDGSFDTIGGGALEHAVIKDAREQIRLGEPRTFNYPLGPLLGQCCGGEVDVFIEPVLPMREAAVFGAGHIAEHLVPMLKRLNFRVTLVDERPERIGSPQFDSADVRLNELPLDALKGLKFNDGLYVIVLTHAHIHDEEIVEYCLDKPLKYLGLIGSKTKWEKFKARYRSRGFKDEAFARVKTPIGLDIGAESPFEIAVSIAGELIKHRI
jgi:xanthine dehydrogenase accessory factor